MKEIPILFNTEMVRALLSGRKTMTRRMIKPNNFVFKSLQNKVLASYFNSYDHGFCPYGQPGDILWVREMFSKNENRLIYRANVCSKFDLPDDFKWKPSIHMPKDACRIFLKVKSVRVERLKDITQEDSMSEGIFDYEDGTYKNYFTQKGLREKDGVECLLPKGSFQSLWCSINGVKSWDENPWVWVIEFEVINKSGKINLKG